MIELGVGELIEELRQEFEEVMVAGAVEGELGDEVVLDGIGGDVVLAVGVMDLVVVVLHFLWKGGDGFGIEAGFE